MYRYVYSREGYMTDIVERLRKLAATANGVPIFADAADEIERLRAVLENIAGVYAHDPKCTAETLASIAVQGLTPTPGELRQAKIAADLSIILAEAEKNSTLNVLKKVAIYFDELELRTIVRAVRQLKD